MESSEIIQIGEYFQEYTKYQYFFTPSEMSQGVAVPNPDKFIPPAIPVIKLPQAEKSLPKRVKNLFTLVKERRSRREYTDEPILLKQLVILLWAMQGVTEFGYGYSFRTVPSAGARHPLETYLTINRVENQSPGLYRNWQKHAWGRICLKSARYLLSGLPLFTGVAGSINSGRIDIFIWMRDMSARISISPVKH
jgi:hypothetical protein